MAKAKCIYCRKPSILYLGGKPVCMDCSRALAAGGEPGSCDATMATGTDKIMDAETFATLKTVCTAGQARTGFNDECNARLEELAENGLIEAELVPRRKGAGRSYTPTEKGRELVRRLSAAG